MSFFLNIKGRPRTILSPVAKQLLNHPFYGRLVCVAGDIVGARGKLTSGEAARRMGKGAVKYTSPLPILRANNSRQLRRQRALDSFNME